MTDAADADACSDRLSPDGSPPQGLGPSDRIRDRPTRHALMIAGGGTAIVGGGLTLLIAAQGGGGRAGLATMLLGGAVSSGLGALYASVTAVIDTLRRRPVPRQRIVTGVVLFLLGAALPGMLVAIGG